MTKCFMCGCELIPAIEKLNNNYINYSKACSGCKKQVSTDMREINNLIQDRHTRHCAYRQVWGDGECECYRSYRE